MKKFILLFIFVISCNQNKSIKSLDLLIKELYKDNSNNTLIINSLRNGVDINSKDNSGESVLHHACSANKYEIVKYLLENGANIDIQDNQGWRPLHEATNSLPIIKLLVEHKANINAQIKTTGETILHLVSADKVQYLLDHGADPNIKDTEDVTPFDSAVHKNDYEKAKILRPVTTKMLPVWLKDYNDHFKQ